MISYNPSSKVDFKELIRLQQTNNKGLNKMITYINTKFHNKIETIDELDSKDFSTYKEFKTECNRYINEYRLSGNGFPYKSQRATNDWKNR